VLQIDIACFANHLVQAPSPILLLKWPSSPKKMFTDIFCLHNMYHQPNSALLRTPAFVIYVVDELHYMFLAIFLLDVSVINAY
jgi:hypothetical protein